MDTFSASLLNGQLRFSKFPDPDEARLLRADGYTCLVNLCDPVRESYLPADVDCDLHYPIPDRTPDVGDIDDFRLFIDDLVGRLERREKICVFCRGGHGRSAMVCAIIWGRVGRKRGPEALSAVRKAHKARGVMDRKWRKMGAPQTLG
jgi:protein-tyrosine phosphatase